MSEEDGLAERYDAVIIGGGHNGLVSAAYLARAGLKTLVLEQRHVLGGAAVTEELFPGFRFSVFSYVVSLLRPEIIRDLELPRHGLDILPLDGTFTPLRRRPKGRSGRRGRRGRRDGDYLWRVNDHGRTIRELRRWSATDAEAYEEYGQLMVEMARFIKPILAITPPDLTSLDPRPLLPLGGLLRTFQQLPERQQAVFVQLMTMSAADFLDQWFETDPLKATMSASGIIGTYLGVRSPGTAYVLLHHYMGEIDGAFRAWGIPKGGTGGISNAIGSAARALGAEIRTEAPVERILVRDGRAVGVVLAGSGEEILADVVLSSVDARRTYLSLLEPGTLDAGLRGRGPPVQVPRLAPARSTSPSTGCPTSPCLPGPGRAPPRRDLVQPVGRRDGAGLRRREVRPVQREAVHRHDHPDPRRPVDGAARQARDQLLRPVRAVPPGAGARVVGRPARGVRRRGRRTGSPSSRRTSGDVILYRNVQTPLDIERTTGLTEGNIFQGELTLEQLF